MENTQTKKTAQQDADDKMREAEKKDITPENSAEKIVIPVKYNKEIRNLNLEEAAVLAQKGLKYESIEKEYNALKELAKKENRSVPEFVAELARKMAENKKTALTEKCGGDQEFAEHIMNLEDNTDRGNGFLELKENFPDFEREEDLPQRVVENSKLKGTLLLDEYLRYLLLQEKEARAAIKKQKDAQKGSTGSLINRNSANNPETEEFLKGLWQR